MDIEELCRSSEGEENAARLRELLLGWYDANHRDMPWRWNARSKKPGASRSAGPEDEEVKAYMVWISEVMLQQTRVETVRRYYQAWMSKWPSLTSLAQATQEEVNVIWAGLGYYRRARFLLEGAKYVVDKCGGVFPRSIAELQQIPGVGKYTAGAIASIAFGQQVPVVDGNVIRVLCRLRAISSDAKESSTIKQLWEIAEMLVDPERPGDFNQALMELGAVVCTPSSPLCQTCALSKSCRALALSKSLEDRPVSVTDFPVKTQKRPPREEHASVCFVELKHEARTSFLLVQRPKKGLLAGLWEFPSVLLPKPTTLPKHRRKAMTEYLERTLGLVLDTVAVWEPVGTYTHVFSHIRLSMHVEWLQLCSDEVIVLNSTPKTRWISTADAPDSGLTSGMKKVYQMVADHRSSPEQQKQAISKRRKTMSS